MLTRRPLAVCYFLLSCAGWCAPQPLLLLLLLVLNLPPALSADTDLSPLRLVPHSVRKTCRCHAGCDLWLETGFGFGQVADRQALRGVGLDVRGLGEKWVEGNTNLT
jgi:hypothetical protein